MGEGAKKIFEVRRIYNDIGFIDEFLTCEFAEQHHLFTYRHNARTNQYEIESRDFEDIKHQLLYQLTNFGEPIIEVTEANYQNRGELYLVHRWDEIDLRMDYAQATLENLQAIWRRPVHIETVIQERGTALFSYNGQQHEQRLLQRPSPTIR